MVDKVKFNGIILDNKLSWCDHIVYIKSKMAKGIGILHRARKIFSTKTLIVLYYCFIYPYLTYCVEVWEMLVMYTLNL